MKDVIERLEADLDFTDGRTVIVNRSDLKALLSYTKQCEEALEKIAAGHSGKPFLDHKKTYSGGFDAGVDWAAVTASEGLSPLIQKGERCE